MVAVEMGAEDDVDPGGIDTVALEALDEIRPEIVEKGEMRPRSAIAVARIDHHDEIRARRVAPGDDHAREREERRRHR